VRHGQFLDGKAFTVLPPPLSILQTPGKAYALGALPAVAALTCVLTYITKERLFFVFFTSQICKIEAALIFQVLPFT
jgi:hypothetical protein